MATIDILPLNINGVKPPLNLLFDLFPGGITDQNLMYPIDLASNPNYGHAIQFTVHNYTYGLTSAIGNLTGGASTLAQSVNPTSLFKLTAQKDILSTISLYMPDTLNVEFNNIYADSSLEEALGTGKYIAGAIADWASAYRGSSQDRSNYLNLYARGLAGALGSVANKDLGGTIGMALKTVPNPQLQLLFKGVGLRTFQFSFIFTPTSSKEAIMVESIINAFQYYSAPALLGKSQQFLEPPQVFDIKFSFLGGSGLTGAFTDFFKNIGTNILTSQVSGAIFGSNQIDPSANPAKIFEIYHPCVLKDINLDYAPNGWAAYADGHPVQTTMTLTFQETDIVTKENIRPLSSKQGSTASSIGDTANQNPDTLAAVSMLQPGPLAPGSVSSPTLGSIAAGLGNVPPLGG